MDKSHASKRFGVPTLGPLLVEHREGRGLTQQELSELTRCKVSVGTIGLIERDKVRRPQRQTVELLGRALALEGAELVAFNAAARGHPLRPPAATDTGYFPEPKVGGDGDLDAHGPATPPSPSALGFGAPAATASAPEATRESPPRQRRRRARRLTLRAAAGTGVVAAGVAVAVLLTNFGSDVQCAFPEGFQPEVRPTADGQDGVRLGDEFVVSALQSDDESDSTGDQSIQELVTVDTSRQRGAEIIGLGAAPTISPDRRQIIFLKEVGDLREPWIMDVMDGESRRFTDHPQCTSSARPAWNQSGSMVAMICQTEDADEREGIYVFDSDGTFHAHLPTEGIPSKLAATTWVGDSALVYGEKDADSEQTRLWMHLSVEAESEPVQVTSDEDGTSHIHADWSAERQALLFGRRADSGMDEGAIFTCGLEGEAQQWGEGQSFVAPTWSPDGSKLAFLVRNEDRQTLFWSSFHNADEPTMWQELLTETNGKKPLPPAWGSR
jgi:transcriptional regulator with XRE-family HTH domain